MTTSNSYASSHRAAIANLDPCFGPDAALLPDSEPLPDAMQQNPHILHVMQILADLFTDRVDTFADTNTIPTPSSITTPPTATGASSPMYMWPLAWTLRRSGSATAI